VCAKGKWPPEIMKYKQMLPATDVIDSTLYEEMNILHHDNNHCKMITMTYHLQRLNLRKTVGENPSGLPSPVSPAVRRSQLMAFHHNSFIFFLLPSNKLSIVILMARELWYLVTIQDYLIYY